MGDGRALTLRRARIGETTLRRIISIADGLPVYLP
jgi:hypothetical protein